MVISSIGEAIKNRRKALKITQPHLAELAGISKNSLYKIERGQADARMSTLDKIIKVLGLEIKLEVTKTKL